LTARSGWNQADAARYSWDGMTIEREYVLGTADDETARLGLQHRAWRTAENQWIEEAGLEVRSVRPIVDLVPVGHLSLAWLRAFIEVGRRRLVDLGYLSESRSAAIWRALTEFEASPSARMTESPPRVSP